MPTPSATDPTVPPPPRPKIVPISTKSSSSGSWSPEQLLEALLDDLRSGKIHPTNLMVFWMDEGEGDDGRLQPRRWIANVSRAEEIAFHTLGIHRAIEDWRS